MERAFPHDGVMVNSGPFDGTDADEGVHASQTAPGVVLVERDCGPVSLQIGLDLIYATGPGHVELEPRGVASRSAPSDLAFDSELTHDRAGLIEVGT